LKKFKKQLSRFTGLGPHLIDVYKRLFWQNSPLIRKYERKTKPKKNKIAPDIAAPQPAVVYIVWAEHKKPTRTIQNTKRRAEHNNLFLGSNNTVVR
jgi:hypothetical protein